LVSGRRGASKSGESKSPQWPIWTRSAAHRAFRIATLLGHQIGFAAQGRLVYLKPALAKNRAVGHDLVARAHVQNVASNEVRGIYGLLLSIANDGYSWTVGQRDLIEQTSGVDLLGRPDDSICEKERADADERIADATERNEQSPDRNEDSVEEIDDIGASDIEIRPARTDRDIVAFATRAPDLRFMLGQSVNGLHERNVTWFA